MGTLPHGHGFVGLPWKPNLDARGIFAAEVSLDTAALGKVRDGLAQQITDACRMALLPDDGEPESATASAYRMQRAEFEADVRRLRQGKAQGG